METDPSEMDKDMECAAAMRLVVRAASAVLGPAAAANWDIINEWPRYN
jgi:hypothetical protein